MLLNNSREQTAQGPGPLIRGAPDAGGWRTGGGPPDINIKQICFILLHISSPSLP